MNRMTQPSTWAGLGILMQVAKTFFPQYAAVIDGLSSAAGALAVAINEQAATK